MKVCYGSFPPNFNHYHKVFEIYFTGTGLFSVQFLGEKTPFITYVDPDPIDVDYVTFYSVVPFIIKYNCPNLESQQTENIPNSVQRTGTNIRRNHVVSPILRSAKVIIFSDSNCLKYDGTGDWFPIEFISTRNSEELVMHVYLHLETFEGNHIQLSSNSFYSPHYTRYVFRTTKTTKILGNTWLISFFLEFRDTDHNGEFYRNSNLESVIASSTGSNIKIVIRQTNGKYPECREIMNFFFDQYCDIRYYY